MKSSNVTIPKNTKVLWISVSSNEYYSKFITLREDEVKLVKPVTSERLDSFVGTMFEATIPELKNYLSKGHTVLQGMITLFVFGGDFEGILPKPQQDDLEENVIGKESTHRGTVLGDVYGFDRMTRSENY